MALSSSRYRAWFKGLKYAEECLKRGYSEDQLYHRALREGQDEFERGILALLAYKRETSQGAILERSEPLSI